MRRDFKNEKKILKNDFLKKVDKIKDQRVKAKSKRIST